MFPWKNHLASIVSGRFFSQNALRQAEDYADGGRVLVERMEQPDDDELEIDARVQGHVRRPYGVNVTIKKTGNAQYTVSGDCSCPMNYNCKHVAAAILAAARNGSFEQQRNEIVTTLRVLFGATGNVEPARPAPPDALSPELTHWLHELESPPARLPAAPATDKRLIFLLSVESACGERRCRITLMRQNVKKSGQLGKATRVSFFSNARDLLAEPYVADIADLLRTIFGQYGFTGDFTLEESYGPILLRKLLDTGRLFWQQASGQPLRLGDPRSARPAWRELADGSQQATFQTEPPGEIFLPLSPPWYLDPAAGACGPLQIDGDPALAQRWLSAPTVKPEETSTLAKAIVGLPIPPPRQVQVKERRNVRPKPVLRLKQVRFSTPQRLYSQMRGSRSESVDTLAVAALAFDYDGLRVEENDPSSVVARRTPDLIERLQRMPRVEATFASTLEDCGFERTERLLWSYDLKEVRNTYALATQEAWLAWMIETVPTLQQAGWIIEPDENFPYRPAQVQDWYTETQGGGNDWFSYELGIVVEGERINLLPMIGRILKLLTHSEREQGRKLESVTWRLENGRIAVLPAERLRSIAATLAELFDPDAFRDGKLQVHRLRAAELIDLHDGGPWRGPAEIRQLHQRLQAFSGIQPVAPPRGLNATLRPYQLEGLSWLQFLREHDFSGILADDMGLGKTVQALAHLLLEKEAGRAAAPSLVIAPTSLMANWRTEAEKFTPGLKTLVLHGGGRKERFDQIPAHDLVVTSYALLPRDREVLEKQNFHLLILDEAQFIKNAKTQWAEICRSLKASHRLCMTGTPMENHLGELWSLMHFLSPGYLGSEKQFRRIYRDPIEKHGDAERRSALARRIRPFIMRRRKEEVAAELPEKTEIVRSVELDGKQRDLYETIRIAMHERVRAEVAQKGLARSHIVILDALLKLRQVCCDPRLVKLERAKSLKDSAKLDLLREMLPEMLSEGRRVLLFSQFTSMLDLIEPVLAKLDIPFVRLDGSTTDRETPVRQFQSGKVPLFLISLKAGGTGLNLTAADTVIHYDPWWNPAVERQATDRAHRIGQDKKVFVYKLVTTGTVEEKILAMQERKKELVAGLLGEGAQQNLQLSKDDLDHLFDPLQ